MSISERIESTIESWSEKWKDRLLGWMASWLSKGVTTMFEAQEPGLKDMARAQYEQIKANPEVPQELKDQLDHAMEAGNILETIFIEITIIAGTFGLLLSGSQPLARVLSYYQDRIKQSARLDPASVITAWRRDPDTYAGLFEDLKDQGWSEARIEALKFFTQFYPGPSDLVRFQAREVFEPEMRERYGLDDEFDKIDLEPFRKAGMTDEVTLYYWRAHWEHASWNQVVEMLHRGQLTSNQVYDWFRLVEIPPFWRDKLIATSWNVPTRVDVRRFYDLRTIDEARLREIYTAMGYHDKDLDDYVLWTKIYVEFPDLLSRWKNGWISLDDVRARLTVLGMSAQAAEELIQTKVQSEGASRTTSERDLTKADIYKGVKDERITRLEGLELLMDLGYDEGEASYILDIYAPSDETVSAVKQRQLTKSDLREAFKSDLVTEDGLRQGLLELRYTAADVELLIRIYKATREPPEEIKLKEASKADIVSGVKKGVITQDEGLAMLLDIGYAPEAADFILQVQTTESPFSPTNYQEFKDLTTKYKIATGREVKPMPEELKAKADELVKIRLEVEALDRAVKAEERQLVTGEPLPEAAESKLKELQVTRNRALAELERIQTEYNGLVAQWKHGAS